MGWRDLVPEMEERLSSHRCQSPRYDRAGEDPLSDSLISHIPHIPNGTRKDPSEQDEKSGLATELEEPRSKSSRKEKTPINAHKPCQEKEEKEEKATAWVDPTAAACTNGNQRRIRVLRWEPKEPPIILTRWSVVTDVEKFARTTLEQLHAAVEGRNWPAGNCSTRELVERLEQVGVLVEIEEVP